MNQTFSDKMRWLSVLGAVAMLMTHASTLQFYPAAGAWEIWAVQIGTELAVPAVAWFFFSAGYWLFRSLTKQQILPRLKRRFFSLVVPYFAWNTLVLAAECLLRVCKREAIPDSIFLTAYCPITPVNGALWFVARLAGYVVLLPLLYPVLRQKHLSAPLVAVAAVLCVYVCPDYYSFFYWLPVFCMGGFIALHGRERLEKHLGQKGRLPWPVVLLVYVLLIVLAHPAMQAGGQGIYLVRVVSIPILIALAALTDCPRAKGWFWTQISFFMFCTHWYIEALLCGKLAAWLPQTVPGTAFVCYVLLCGITMALSCGALRLMHRFAPRTLAILMGNRG